MNKVLLIIIAVLLLVIGFLVFDSPSKDQKLLQSNNSGHLEIEIIQPPELSQVEDEPTIITKPSNDLNSRFQAQSRADEFDDGGGKFTKEGQAFTTLGELLVKNETHVDTDKYSEELLMQLQQAKYNLKISKEIAHLSKSLFIETDKGNVIDEEVHNKIKELRNELIVKLKSNDK
jgi:hypothetical protein